MRGHIVPVFLWVWSCFTLWCLGSVETLTFHLPLNDSNSLSLTKLLIRAWLVKTALSVLSVSFFLPPGALCVAWSALSAPRVLLPGEDLERNDGSSSRPYFMSAGLHKILRRGEEGTKMCSASWAMLWLNYWLFLSLLHICCKCGGLVWMFQSEHCRAIYQNWMHLAPAWAWSDIFTPSQERHRGLENTCLLPVLSQLRYLPFSATPVFFFPPFFLFSLYFLTSALLRGYVSTRRTDAQAQMKTSIFTQTDTRTLTCTEAANKLWRRSSSRTVVDSRCTLLSHFGLLV